MKKTANQPVKRGSATKAKSDEDVAKEISAMAGDAYQFVAEKGKFGEIAAVPEMGSVSEGGKGKAKEQRTHLAWVGAADRHSQPRQKAGRPPAERQESVAQMVALFVAMGISQEAIAERFGMSKPTLLKLYSPEVIHGREINEMFWIGSLASAARKGKVEAIRFALERKFGWIEKSQVTINDGESGIIFSGDRPPARDITDATFEEVGPANAAPVRDTDDEDAV